MSVHLHHTTGSADSMVEGDQEAVVAAVDGMGNELVIDGAQRSWPGET